jgi:hypothetical protein
MPACLPACRKGTEVLRINLRTGRLELENDHCAESSYETEVPLRLLLLQHRCLLLPAATRCI